MGEENLQNKCLFSENVECRLSLMASIPGRPSDSLNLDLKLSNLIYHTIKLKKLYKI
jgi:hypothetical protein